MKKKLLLFFLISVIAPIFGMDDEVDVEEGMEIVRTYEGWFADPKKSNAMEGRGEIPVEREAYNYLKKQPIKDPSVTYVPVPFYYYLYNKKLHEASFPVVDPKQKTFTITHVEHLQRLLPLLRKHNIKVVFAVNATKDDLASDNNGVTKKAFPYSCMNDIKPSKEKDIFYSFMGTALTYPKVRRKIFDMKHSAGSVIVERKAWGHAKAITPEERARQAKAFRDTLASSRFSLCPRGEGPQTIRFYESLKAGAIPVVISDDATYPESDNWNQDDWQKCMITVPEDDIQNLQSYLNINQEKEAEMRKKCYEASQCFEGEKLVDPVRHYYREKK